MDLDELETVALRFLASSPSQSRLPAAAPRTTKNLCHEKITKHHQTSLRSASMVTSPAAAAVSGSTPAPPTRAPSSCLLQMQTLAQSLSASRQSSTTTTTAARSDTTVGIAAGVGPGPVIVLPTTTRTWNWPSMSRDQLDRSHVIRFAHYPLSISRGNFQLFMSPPGQLMAADISSNQTPST